MADQGPSENEFSKEVDKLGRPLWDKILHDLIADTYLVPRDIMTERDVTIQCILITLHEAIQGKTDLESLAQACVLHNKVSSAQNFYRQN